MTAERTQASEPEAGHPRRHGTLVVSCLALGAVMFANTALSISLPYLSRDLHASTAQLQWFSNAYAIVFAALLLTTSALGDRWGRRAMLHGGLAAFAVVSLASVFVVSGGQLIALRAAAGLAAAMIMPATLSVLVVVFPPARRPWAIGVWAAVSVAGGTLGPVLGGVLVEWGSWRAVFVGNALLAVAASVVGLWCLPAPGPATPRRIDAVGVLGSAAGLSLIVYGITATQTYGWWSVPTATTLLAGALVLTGYGWWELRRPDPMFDVRVLARRAFTLPALCLTVVFLIQVGLFFSLGQTMQVVFGYSPLLAGVAALPVTVVGVILGPRAHRQVARFGARTVVSGGLVLVAAGAAGLATITTHSSYGGILWPLMLVSVGTAFVLGPSTNLVMSALPADRAAEGAATNDAAREIGAAVGVALLGALIADGYRERVQPLLSGLGAAARTAATSSLVGGQDVAVALGGGGAAVEAVHRAWLGGLVGADLVAAGLLLVAAVLALGLPGRGEV